MGKIGKEQLAREMFEYFSSITEQPLVIVEILSFENEKITLDLENMIALFLLDVYDLYSFFSVKAIFVSNLNEDECDQNQNNRVVYTSSKLLKHMSFSSSKEALIEEIKENTEFNLEENRIFDCRKPSVHMVGNKMNVAGLSAVLRFILKFTCRRHDTQEIETTASGRINRREILDKLLGYQRGCLQACAESSIWTKFCEVDMIQATVALRDKLNELVNGAKTNCSVDKEMPLSLSSLKLTATTFEFPKDLLRLEYHLTRPVRIHNFRKRIQTGGEKEGENNQDRSHKKGASSQGQRGGIQVDGLAKKQPHPQQIPHDFAEGPDITLADVLLFPCVEVAIHVLGHQMFEKYVPTVYNWHRRVKTLLPVSPTVTYEDGVSPTQVHQVLKDVAIQVPEIPQESLYKSDPLRYKAKLRLFTKQDDIEAGLKVLSEKGIQALNFNESEMPSFNWSSVPLEVHPEGGQLPPARVEKKSHQLSNLALMVVKVFEDKYASKSSSGKRVTIVDFCSGGGHLGILLAYLLPQCEIILVENKEESLRRAEKRVKLLSLTNITFFQCNLDYFTGHFEIGVALHACGTATDLVLTKCVGMRSSFVCCPCCYGGIQSNHMLQYPRSSTFLDAMNSSSGLFSSKHYLVLGHAADQTHEESNEKTQQGQVCMRMIDTDRCSHAEENNYDVFLQRMRPPTCSPKNHILVGVPRPE